MFGPRAEAVMSALTFCLFPPAIDGLARAGSHKSPAKVASIPLRIGPAHAHYVGLSELPSIRVFEVGTAKGS